MLALAPQALAHEFDGSTASAQTAHSASMEFIIGAGAVKCRNTEVEYTPSVGLFPKLTITIIKLEKCKLNGGEVGAGPNGCQFELSSSGLIEPNPGFFQDGSLGFKCSSALGLETTHCGITIGSQTPLSLYEWENLPAASPSEGELTFRLSGIRYTVTGTGCGTSGSNGEYRGAIVLPHVIIR
ncbi:MAG TPA: hypothetical protein VGY13_13585 [Solirubrobacteraceae bacterium]|jgi:hypothetical protein|nr:hypothetical protein [Solirubrobacteraceae bacterium]